MFKRYFSSTDEKRLKEQSYLMFNEVANGIYYVEKDRTDRYTPNRKYLPTDEVIHALNVVSKVAVTGRSGVFANFELKTKEEPKVEKVEGFKVGDEVLILSTDGTPVGEGIVANVNDFREPSMKYAVDVIGYDEDVLFFGESQLVKK